jgi:hypothetical protein
VLATDDGTTGCASLLPLNNPSLIGLPAGKYYARVLDLEEPHAAARGHARRRHVCTSDTVL